MASVGSRFVVKGVQKDMCLSESSHGVLQT